MGRRGRSRPSRELLTKGRVRVTVEKGCEYAMGTTYRNGRSRTAFLAGAIACTICAAFADDTPSGQHGPLLLDVSPATADKQLPTIYAQQYAAGNFSEAADAAKAILAGIASDGSDDLSYADALEMLANAQHMAGDTVSAVQNFRGAVERIESAEDRLAARLVSPLAGLARSLRESGAILEAIDEYERAAHITRVNEGPLNVSQCELLADLIDIYAEQARYDKAIGLQNYRLEIFRRAFAETDPQVVNAWRRSGELLSLSGNHHDAQELYTYAMDIIRVADGSDSLAQLELLSDLSESYLQNAQADRFTRIELARSQLDRAVSIAESNERSTPEQRFDAHLRMGDFMQRFGEWNSALVSYRKAWHSLNGDPSQRNNLDAAFARPVSLLGRFRETGPSQTGGDATTVRVVYDVDRRGRADNVRIPEESVDADLARKAKSKVQKMIFRPTFRNGHPVAAPDVADTIEVTD